MSEPEEPVTPLEPPIPSQNNELNGPTMAADFADPNEHTENPAEMDENSTVPVQPRYSRKILLAPAAALILVAAVLVIVFNTSSTREFTPREAVVAAENTAAKPLTMSFSLAASISTTKGKSFQVVNDPIKLTGDGALDRTTHTMLMNMKIKVATLTLHAREILSKKSVFIKFSALDPYLKSGKSWVQVPSTLFASKSSIANVGTSPLILKQIRKNEITITADGSATVNGTKLSLYKLKPDAAANKQMTQGIATSGVFGERISLTYVLGIDSQHVLRQVNGTIVTSLDNTHQLETLSMTFLSYNQPVVIKLPFTKETEKLNTFQYLKLVTKAQAAPPSLV
jgi:hypothetical protein